MPRPRTALRRNVAIISGLLVVYLIYVAVRLFMLASSGTEALKSLEVIKKNANKSSIGKIQTDLADLTTKVQSVSSISNDPVLAPVSWIPGLGQDFSAIGQLSSATTDLLTTAQPLISTMGVLSDSRNGGDWNSFKADAMADLPNQIDQLNQVVSQTDDLVDRLSKAHLNFGLSEKISPFEVNLREARSGLNQLRPIVAVMGPVLSQKHPATWFIATQNLAEARATGGILGSFAIVNVSRGKVDLIAAGSDKDLARLGKVDSSALPAEIRSLWGTDNEVWQDMNASLHVPYFAEQLVDSVAKVKKIDGVIVLGQGTVARMVAASGSLNVDGVAIDASNASDFLSKGIYSKYPIFDKKNAWLVAFMESLFGRLSTQKIDVKSLWNSSVRAKTGDRMAAWSANKKIQAQFEKYGVAGEVSSSRGSTTYFSINNGGGNKLDAYLHIEASYALKNCGAKTDDGFDGRAGEIKIRLRNSAPKSGLPAYVTTRLDTFGSLKFVPGSNREVISIYAPVGASLRDFKLDGKPVLVSQGFDREHPVWLLDVSLNPGQTGEIVGTWVEPVTDVFGRDNQTAPVLFAPVSLNPIKISATSTGYCSVEPR